MKKNLPAFLVSALLMLGSMCFAQPILTSTGVNPVIGDSLIYKIGNWVNPGNQGVNQTWNLSSITVANTINEAVVASSSTPNGSSFPNSNICFKYAGINVFSYFKTSSSSWQSYGAFDQGVTMAFSNPEDVLHFPFTYNNSYIDTWASNFVSSGTAYYRTGTDSVTADGYGMLITPKGNFSNVLRVHFVQNYQDSADIGGSPYIITYHNDEYMWYSNGNHSPIALVTTVITSTNPNPQSAAQYLDNAVSTSIEENNFVIGYNIFPNPVADFLNLDIKLIKNNKAEIRVFNSIGAQVLNTRYYNGMEGDNNFKINIENLPPGIYQAQVILDGKTSSATRRFVVIK